MKTKKRTTSRKVLGLALSAALALSSLPVADVQVAKAADSAAKASANQAGESQLNDEGNGVTASGTFGGTKDSTGAEITPDTHQWSFAADTGTLTISGEGEIPDYTSSTYTRLPWYGYKDDIKKIVFTGNVAKVGGYMFYNYKGVEEVDFSAAEKLTEIGADSFNGTAALGTLTGTERLTTLGMNCFKSSGLKAVTMPKVEAVPEGAFNGCKSLGEIHFQGATAFGKQAFNQCSVLKDVDAPNVGSLGESVFNTCTALETIGLPELVSVTGGSVFYGCSKLQSISFPKLATMNGNNAFANCTSLEMVDLSSLTELKTASSFAKGCTSLTSVDISNAPITGTDAQMFADCSSLVYVDVSSAKDLDQITIFSNCSSLKRIYLKGTNLAYTLTEKFYNTLKTNPAIYHLDTVNKMGTYANLQGVSEADFNAAKAKETHLHLEQEDYDIESPVEPKLTGNAQGATVTYKYYTNAACSTLVNADSPTSKPTVAGDYYVRAEATATEAAFATNSNPAGFRIYGDIPGEGYFYNNRTNILTITSASVVETDYASASSVPWYSPYRLTLEKVVFQEGVSPTKIGKNAFYRLTHMTSLELPETVTSIGENAFCSCSAWEAENVLTAKVTSIGASAFQDCRKLTGTMTLSENITEIPALLFYGCAGITQIKYDADKITSFGDRAFYGTSVTEMALPSNATEVPASIFSGCAKLASVTIPASVTALGSSCFQGCESLTEIVIPEGVTTLGDYCLSGTGLTSIALPATVTTWGKGVFGSTKNLETFEIPDSMTALPESVFKDSGLKKLIVPATVTQIGKDALRGLSQLEYLEFEKEDYTDDTLVGSPSSQTSGSVTIKYDQTFGGVSQTAMIVCDGATYDLLAARGTLRPDALNGWLAEEVLYKRSKLLADLEAEYNAAKEEAGKLTEADYDSESWAAFQTALAEADALFAKGETTYEIITNRMAAAKSIPVAAKPFLRATYQKTLDILEEDYDTDGDGADAWFDYLDQRDLALELLQKEDATFAEIIQSDKQLRKALGDIVLRPVDGPKAEVEQAIQSAGALKEADYTPESWAALQAAIKEAQEICKDATKVSQVAGAKKKIDDAVAGLVRAAAGDPSAAPSTTPSTDSSTKPSATPSAKPSADPSAKPSTGPSANPSTKPSAAPSTQPTKNPGGVQPTKNPGGSVDNPNKVTVKKVALKKVKSTKKKTITVQWKKVSGVTGYQVQIGTNKKVTKGKKTYTVKKAKTTKKTIKKLKRKKKYYVRVRAYKTVKGKKYYGKWSSVKKVKVK